MANESMEALLKAGEVEKARALAEEALRKNAQDRNALITLAKLAMLEGAMDKAESLVNRATQGGKEDDDTRLVRAALASNRGERERSKAIYEEILRSSDRAEAHFGLGFIQASLNDYKNARQHLEQAVRLDPTTAPYHFHLARVLFAQEELQLGLPHLEKALELNPYYVPVYVAWTEVLMQLGDLTTAQDLLEKGLELMEGHPELLHLLGNVLAARGDVEGAFAITQELAKAFPEDPAAQGNYARMLAGTGHHKEALDVCRRVNAAGKTTAQIKEIEAMVLEAQNPPDEAGAAAAWREAMKLAPADWAPANNLGNLLMRTPQGAPQEKEHLTEAVTVLEEARRRAPERIEPVLNLAIVYMRTGAKDKAQVCAREVLQRTPESARALREQADRILKSTK